MGEGEGGGDGTGTNVFDMSMTRGAASKTVFRLLGFLLSSSSPAEMFKLKPLYTEVQTCPETA